MADNYLITGYWGEPHVTAENDRGINAAIFGTGRFVLPVGEQFRAEYIGNNTIRMYDGKLMDNGAAAGIPAGEYVDLLIANAGQGMNRNDLIVFQYSQDPSTLIESGIFTVVQGEESETTASDPELTQEDLLSGTAAFDQMALWRVSVSGTAVSAPVQLFEAASLGMTEERMWDLLAGFGIGGRCSQIFKAYDDLKTGWYLYSGEALIEGRDPTKVGLLRVEWSPVSAKQTLYPHFIYEGSISRSMGQDGVWSEWGYDCVNLNLTSGNERPTSEFYLGNQVYYKRVEIASLQGSTTQYASLGVTPRNIVSIEAFCVDDDYFFPLPGGNGGVFSAYYFVDSSGRFGVRTMDSLMNGKKVVAHIKYIKP